MPIPNFRASALIRICSNYRGISAGYNSSRDLIPVLQLVFAKKIALDRAVGTDFTQMVLEVQDLTGNSHQKSFEPEVSFTWWSG